MPFDDLYKFVALILALSLASERLVEIIKGLFPTLGQQRLEESEEQQRKAKISLIAIGAGLFTGWLAGLAIGKEHWTYLLAGFLSSGGSAFWSSILGYLGQIKNLKQAEAQEKKLSVRRSVLNEPDDAKRKAITSGAISAS